MRICQRCNVQVVDGICRCTDPELFRDPDPRCDCSNRVIATPGPHAPACATRQLPEEGVAAPDGSGWSR